MISLDKTLAKLMLPGVWQSALLVTAWLFIFNASRASGWRVAVLSLFGTWLHELSHFFVGLILLANPVSFSLWPKRQGNGWVLGSVGFTRLNLINSAFVGLSPLLLLALAWWVFNWLPQILGHGNYPLWIGLGYVCAACLFSGKPSSTDIKIAAPSVLVYAVVGAAFWLPTRMS